MASLLPFFLPALGLSLSFSGLWGLFASLRAGRGAGPEVGPNSESSAEVKSKVDISLRKGRIVGIFWFCLGIATICLSDFHAPYILPLVGLFWVVVGAGGFFSTFRKDRQAAFAAKVIAESASSNTNARGGLSRRLLSNVFSLCLGILILWFSGIHIGVAPAAVSKPREENSRFVEIVTQQVVQDFEDQGRVGLVVGAIANAEEVLLPFGSRQLGSSQPPDADTVFEIGSISKTFTGILLAQMIENGELELDDRIAELLPEGWTLSDSASGITLRHCTTHTSGFPRLPANLFNISGVFRHLFGGDPYREYSKKEFRDALATVKLESEPGTQSNYSNFAVGLLGFVLSTKNGTDYETLVTSKICQPLGMHATGMPPDDQQRENMPAKYRATLKAGPAMIALESDDWRLPNHLAGAGAIRSTGRDTMTFLKANMGLLSTPFDAAIQRSHQKLFQERDSKAMGMNWVRSFDSNISRNVIWHNGGTGGFRTYLGFTEDRQYGVFVLSNTAVSVDALAGRILDSLVKEYAPGSRKPVTKHGYAKIAPYTGVRWENDRPIVQVEGHWSPLVSIDGIEIDRIMDFAQQRFGEKARKRFAEDLVELLSEMGHEPNWEVTLGLETGDGQVKQLEITMTEENRNLVRN